LWAGKSADDAIGVVAEKIHKDVEAERMTPEEGSSLLHSLWETLKRYEARWSRDQEEFEVVAVEEWVEARVRTAGGSKGRARFGGVLDHVVRDRINDQFWLVEHKGKMQGTVTERDLERRRQEPQAVQYALLWREKTGRQLAGVIYDIASLARVPDPASWGVLKVERDLAKRPPRGARPETLAAALKLNDLPRLEWHDELEATLAAVPAGSDWPRNAKGGLAKKVPPNARPETLLAAVEETGGEKPAWFDETLAELSFEAAPEDWTVVQRGKPGLVKTAPSGAIRSTLINALDLHGFEFGSQEWHSEVLEELTAYEQNLFAREWVRFSDREVELAGREVYQEATEVERDRRVVEAHRAKIEASCDDDGTPDGFTVEDALEELGPRFPRNGRICWEFNRVCEYADLCGSRNADAARVFRVKGKRPKSEEELAARRSASEMLDV